ncbi:hypothetical protein HELRODRAFT_166703 [Helobdella robusta]|uniref:Uncharacterized protein n=1 Tax=Helobdella robusta TaxID=6412 RepID=T1EYE3_HELRO|nr:hypothetical protein HELRODRAFT_166703 [Helobdella robusta]ESO11688.1 hypothetical protein HELRODRAFT_166703 [Helobdella robusta]
MSMPTYSSVDSWNVTTIKLLGNIVAGVPVDSLLRFTPEKLASIVPSVFAVLPHTTLANLTNAQLQSLTTEQLLQINHQLKNMTSEKRDFIVSLQNNRTSGPPPPQSSTGPPRTTNSLSNSSFSTLSNSSATTNSPTASNSTFGSNPSPGATNSTSSNSYTTANPSISGSGSSSSSTNSSTATNPSASTNSSLPAANSSSAVTKLPSSPTSNATNLGTNADFTSKTAVPTGNQSNMVVTTASANAGVTPSAKQTNTASSVNDATTPPSNVATNAATNTDSAKKDGFTTAAIPIGVVQNSNKLTPNDVEKIDPSVLKDPSNVEKLVSSSADMSVQLVILNLIEDSFANTDKVDPPLYAAIFPALPDQCIMSMSTDLVIIVIAQPNFHVDVDKMQSLGTQVADAITKNTSNIQTLGKALAAIPPSNFQTFLNKQKITMDFLQNFNSTLLTEEQIDLSKMTPAENGALLKSFPTAVCQSLKSNDVTNLSKEDSLIVLTKIINSLNDVKDVDAGRLIINIDVTFFFKIKSPDFLKTLSVITMKLLLQSNLLTPQSVLAFGTGICPMIQTSHPLPNCATASTLYDVCKTDVRNYCVTGITNTMGGFLTASDVSAVDDKSFSDLCLIYLCPNCFRYKWATSVKVVSSALDKNPSLITLYRKIDLLLPYLNISYFDALPSAAIPDFCSTIACQRGSFKNVTMRKLSCSGNDYSLFLAHTRKQFYDSNVSCDSVKATLDVLQSTVLDCGARGTIYNCVKGQSFTTVTDVAKLGTLIGQMSDSEFANIPKKYLCGRLSRYSKIIDKWHAINDDKTECGFRPLNLCNNFDVLIFRLKNADASADCKPKTASSRRRKRDGTLVCSLGHRVSSVGRSAMSRAAITRWHATALTCSTVKSIVNNLPTLAASSLSTLSNADFTNCVSILGKVRGFSQAQWQALAIVAKKVFGETSRWTSEQIISAAGIVSGLSASDVSALLLTPIETVFCIGNFGNWSDDNTNLLSGKVSSVTSGQLKSMGEVICGATVPDLSQLTAAAVCDVILYLGQLSMCDGPQLTTLIALVKADTCYGSSVAKWPASKVHIIGNLIGGLSKDDLASLSTDQVKSIPSSSIPYIPILTFNVIRNKLKSISSEISLNVLGVSYNGL